MTIQTMNAYEVAAIAAESNGLPATAKFIREARTERDELVAALREAVEMTAGDRTLFFVTGGPQTPPSSSAPSTPTMRSWRRWRVALAPS